MFVLNDLKTKIKKTGVGSNLYKGIHYVNNYLRIKINKILQNIQPPRKDYVEKAIKWIKNYTVETGGIIVSSKQKIAYPEVTGYFIPTLYQWGEKELAKDLIKWLISQQNEDGSFCAPNGIPYTFDTGQVIRGFVASLDDFPEVEKPLRKACDWVLSQIKPNGKLITPSKKDWGDIADERIHLYVLLPLIQAGIKLREQIYIDSAKHVLEYYKNYNDLIKFNTLSHFYGYIIEALFDLGEHQLAKEAMDGIVKIQKRDGRISAYKNSSWVCIPGMAQLAVVFYKLGMIENGDRALRFLEKTQNENGGFYGSLGIGANYFPFEEISWATKFFLDAYYWRIKASFEKKFDIFPETININDGRIQEIISFFGDLNNKKVIDVGCGKGRFIKELQSLFSKAEFYGIDISEKMLDFCPKKAKVSVGNILNINYPDETFDFVYCVEALEHAIRVEKAIQEMCRILKPGGKIVIIDKNLEKTGQLQIESWEQWFKQEQIIAILKNNRINARSKEITYEDYNQPDGLFIAWEGIKKNFLDD